MGKVIESVLLKGFISKGFAISYLYDYDLDNPKFPTIKEIDDKNISIDGSFVIKIRYGKDQIIWVPRNKYSAFVSLLEKATRMTQENLFELFPDIGNIEFDMDDSALDRFQKEKALNTAGFTMMPAVWTDGSGTCLPGIMISDEKGHAITIPLEECIGINQMFKVFDPYTYGMQILSMLIKIE
jgi:hypothetical protein